MKIRSKLLYLFLIFGFVGSSIGLIGFTYTQDIDLGLLDIADDTDQEVIAAIESSSYAKRAEGHMMLYLTLNNEIDREKFFLRHASMIDEINSLRLTLSSSQYLDLIKKSDDLLLYGNAILKKYDENPSNFIPKDHEELIQTFHNAASDIRKTTVNIANYRSLHVQADVLELQDKSSSLRDNILFGIVLSLTIPVILGFLLSRTIVNPISLLIDATQKIADGKYDIKIHSTGSDEITELSKSFQTMSNMLQESEIKKNEFISMITHELKTPLVPIQGYVEILANPKMGSLNESQKEALSIINTSCFQLNQLISNLLNTQRLELDNLNFKKTNVNLGIFLQNVYDNLLPILKSKNIKFFNSTSIDIDLYVDKSKLMEIFVNLIQNSIDFVNENTGKIEFGVYDETNTDVILFVKDNGEGIPANKQKDIFQKFWQVDLSRTRKHGGTGLGLSICKNYVEKMDGKIWVNSTEGKGTIFYMSFPKNRSNKSQQISKTNGESES